MRRKTRELVEYVQETKKNTKKTENKVTRGRISELQQITQNKVTRIAPTLKEEHEKRGRDSQPISFLEI